MKIAFVLPWFSFDIAGGAEHLAKRLALELKELGNEITILTTCIKQFHSDWNHDFYEEGVFLENLIKIKRFKVRKRDTELFDKINAKLLSLDINKLKELHSLNENYSPLNDYEEKIFIDEIVNSTNLYTHIEENSDRYDCFIFIPYMFGTTYYGIKYCKNKKIIIPCMHDESYAYMKIYKEMIINSDGIIFLTDIEKNLAEKLFEYKKENSIVLGMGIEKAKNTGGDTDVLKKYKIEGKYILYAGRKEKGKNVDELVSFFSSYKKHFPLTDLKLVIIGDNPVYNQEDIFDLGFLSIDEKNDLIKNCSLFCLPSLYESFSIAIMEAWQFRKPVLVNGNCLVLKTHCVKSSGGLYYTNYMEFCESINYILDNKNLSIKLGENGEKYVSDNYIWNKIAYKYNKYIKDLINE